MLWTGKRILRRQKIRRKGMNMFKVPRKERKKYMNEGQMDERRPLKKKRTCWVTSVCQVCRVCCWSAGYRSSVIIRVLSESQTLTL